MCCFCGLLPLSSFTWPLKLSRAFLNFAFKHIFVVKQKCLWFFSLHILSQVISACFCIWATPCGYPRFCMQESLLVGLWNNRWPYLQRAGTCGDSVIPSLKFDSILLLVCIWTVPCVCNLPLFLCIKETMLRFSSLYKIRKYKTF